MKNEVLFEEYRADVLECVHYGNICVVDRDGIVASVGTPDWTCFYRSASKPIQALPILLRELDKKYGLTEQETALFSGSHWGDEEHVAVLESIMAKTGLREEQMIMLPTYPNRPDERERLLREQKPPRKIYHNCSGKHLGMMLLAREMGESVERYWMRDSKTQHEILRVLSLMSGVAADTIRVGVDGCGVPVYAVPFSCIATSYLRLMCPELIEDTDLQRAVARNVEILHRYPNMIAGKDIVDTVLTSDGDLIAKSGALGVFAIGIRSRGLGIVAKTIDGSHDEFAATALHVCQLLGYQSDVLERVAQLYPNQIINDTREVVGYRKAVFQFTK